MPDPEHPGRGLGRVSLDVTSKLPQVLRQVHAAVWLPRELGMFTPHLVFGSNLAPGMWDVDLSPQQPGMGLHSIFRFDSYSQRDQVRDVFRGPTRVKIVWQGGVRFIEFPGHLWDVQVAEP